VLRCRVLILDAIKLSVCGSRLERVFRLLAGNWLLLGRGSGRLYIFESWLLGAFAGSVVLIQEFGRGGCLGINVAECGILELVKHVHSLINPFTSDPLVHLVGVLQGPLVEPAIVSVSMWT